jgi:exo-beta-1,3-glucanase (GH17 family)
MHRFHMPHLPHTLSRSWLAVLIQLAGVCLVLAWWGARGLPISLVELPSAQASALPCVSYSPFHRGDINPFNYQASVTPEQIEADLRLLKTRTNCIRTYGLSQGLDGVPAVAARLGMRVNLGIWLSRDTAQNQAQLKRGLELAHQYTGTVTRLVVGNEVLLRREMAPDELGKILDYAKQHSPVPVTYADVWEFWQRHAQLARHVDMVTVHILPYWEDDPVAVGDAVAHVLGIADKMKNSFAGKPVWVGETGWPAAGRQRAGAVPGRVEQARFVRELVQRTTGASGTTMDYNFIEAFDQPWKRSFEGAMGGYWGLFDPTGQAHAPMVGSVTEDAGWWRGWLGALAGAAIGCLWGGVWLRRTRVLHAGTNEQAQSGQFTVAIPALAYAILGALAPVQWLMVQQWDRTGFEQSVSGALAFVSLLVTWAAALRWMKALNAPEVMQPGCEAQVVRFAHWQIPLASLERALHFALLFAAASAALVLLLDSRYRPFPWWWFLAPTTSLLALRLAGYAPDNALAYKQQVLAGILAACALGIALLEGWQNAQALGYCALLLVLAGAAAWPSRTKTSRASSAAGAHSSVV